MPCILDLTEFNIVLDAIEMFEDLAAQDDTDMLGVALLMAARSRLVKEMLDKVGECDDANAGCLVKLAECPAYKIMKERIYARLAKRATHGAMFDIIEADDRGDYDIDDGPDGFI
jgi:hypothetical protein